MKGLRRHVWLSLGFAAAVGTSVAMASGDSRIQSITVKVDGETDLPRVLDLLGVREGDLYYETELERGLVRLADSGKFLGVQSGFDRGSGQLLVQLSLVPRVSLVTARLTPAEGEEIPATLESDIVGVSGLTLGDPIFSDQLPAIRDRILARLRERGYRSAQGIISLEQVEGSRNPKVVILADLGRRSVIRDITLHGFRPAEVAEFYRTLDLPAAPAPKNDADIKVSVNMPHDAIQMDERVNLWNRRAREKGFYDFQLKINEQESGSDFHLTFDLAPGPRYVLKFHGNTEFWSRDMREKITDRPLRLGVPLSIQEAQASIVRDYEKAGYGEVTVRTRIEDKKDVRYVHFDIKQGPQLLLGQIRFLGVSDEQAAELNVAAAEWRKKYRNPMHKTPYDEKFLRSELPSLIAKIRGLGYLDARLLELRALVNPASPFVNVDLPMQLGERYTVATVALEGNISLGKSDLDQLLTLKPGAPADPGKVIAIRDALVKKYRSLGFLYARIDGDENALMKKVPESQRVEIQYEVEQGPLVKVGRAEINGLRKTKEKVVLRELGADTLNTGQTWAPEGSDLLEQRLLNLNIFGSANLEPVGGRILQRGSPDGSTVEIQEKDLKISVNERPSGTIEFGPGFRNDKGVIGFAELNYRNLAGWNRSIQLHTQISHKITDAKFFEQNYSFTYLEPFILEKRMRFRFNAQYDKSDKNYYDANGVDQGYSSNTKLFSFTTETTIAKNVKWIQNLYTLAFTHIFDQTPEQNYRVGTVGTTFTYDNRDNIFNPSRGWLLSSTLQYASPAIGSKAYDSFTSDVNFISGTQQASTYLRVGSDSVLALSLTYTRIWDIKNSIIPLPNRPTLGGSTTIRSLPEQSLQFSAANFNTVGDQTSYLAKLEYRQPVFGDLGIAYFIDTGEIDATQNNPDGTRSPLSTGMRTGIGVGVRYKTVVGPASFDVAYNTNPNLGNNEDLVRFVFSIGAF